jgi:hypothetical protein
MRPVIVALADEKALSSPAMRVVVAEHLPSHLERAQRSAVPRGRRTAARRDVP